MGQLLSMFFSLIGQLRLPTPTPPIQMIKLSSDINKLIDNPTEDTENIETFTGNIENLLKTRTNTMSNQIFKRNVNENILGPNASSI